MGLKSTAAEDEEIQDEEIQDEDSIHGLELRDEEEPDLGLEDQTEGLTNDWRFSQQEDVELFGPEQYEEEELEVTWEESQAVRESFYVKFNGEDETDYTEGPARIIKSADGMKECGALLMTLDLSQAIQKAVKAQRRYAKSRTSASRKKKALLHLSFDIESQMANHKRRLGALQSTEYDGGAERAEIEQQMETLGLMLDENKTERQSIQTNLDYQCQMLREVQEEANAILEDALTAANIMEAEPDELDLPMEELDLPTEYEAFQRKLQETKGTSTVAAAPLNTDNKLVAIEPEQTPEEQETERLQKAVWEAALQVQSAQAHFDRREVDRVEEEEFRESAIQRGEQPMDATSEVFDIR